MTDLHDRMRIYDRAPAPDYWNEVELRASARARETAAPARSARPLLLLAAAMLLALAVGGAALALSRLVEPPPDSSVTNLAYGLDGDIYLAEMDGTNPMRIADGVPIGDATECESSFYGFGPMWSPDGRYLAYRADHWGALDGPPECSGTVYLSDADGQPVASFPGTGWLLSWSPDSTRIATWVDLYATIGIYGIDGARQALLTLPDECTAAGDYDPLWSPDGSSVVIPGHPQAGEDVVGSDLTNPEACELPLDGSAPRVLPAGDPRYRQMWSYSPDEASVAYVVEPAPDPYDGTAPPPDVSLVVAAADGSNERVLISTGVSPLGSPLMWSPTGDRIAVAGGEVGVPKEVLLVDVPSGTVTSVFSARGDEVLEVMAFSPDGTRLLFAVRDADWGPKGLWSVKVDGSDARLHVAGTDWGDWQLLPPGSEPSATPVALPPVPPVPSVPPDSSGSQLAYGLDGDIYLADADGQNPVRIADGAPGGVAAGECGSLYGFGPMWSPDGRYLVYRSDHWGDPACPGTVHLSDAAGQPVASFPGTGWLLSWSPDSTRIATWVDLQRTIGVYGIDGVRQALLTVPRECANGGDFDPMWSPDGESLWVAGTPPTPGCEVPIDGSTPAPVPEGDPRSRSTAAYSPDGTRVAYLGDEADSNFNAIPLTVVVAEADGSQDRVLIAAGVAYGNEVSLVWSPTGDRIAFHGGPLAESLAEFRLADEILVVDVASGSVTSLASVRAGERIYALAFSRDGDRILFTRMDAANYDASLWSVNADGSDPRLLVTGTGWGDWQQASTPDSP